MAEVASGLRARVATALLLAPLAIAAVLLLPTPWLAGLLAIVFVAGALEWARLGGLRAPGGVGLGLYQLGLLGAGYLVLSGYPRWFVVVLGLCAGWWLGVGLAMILRRAPIEPDDRLRPLLLIGAPLLSGIAWIALVRLHAVPSRGPLLVLALLVLVWLADSAAYFAGRAFGRHRLAPVVSPGKTVEGLAGAVAGAAVFGAVLGGLGVVEGGGVTVTVALCVVVAVLSVAGDLFESFAKRAAGLKDSGRLLPGHGGVLDRIDSLIAAAPVFVLGMLLLWGPG